MRDEDIAALQDVLLEAVLTGRPLPGRTDPLRFPDLAFLINQETVPLLDENLAGPIAVRETPKPVRIITRTELENEARQAGDLAYLAFAPPEIDESTVQLTMHAHLASADPVRPMLGLGGVRAQFRRIDDQWQAEGDPVLFAT